MSPARSEPWLTALLGLLTVLPVLAATPAAGFPIGSEQKLAIDNSDSLGPGAPYGTWLAIDEPARFYLHDAAFADTGGENTGGTVDNVTGQVPGSPNPPSPAPADPGQFTMDLRRPTNPTFTTPQNNRIIVFDGVGGGTNLNEILVGNGLQPTPADISAGDHATFLMPASLVALDDVHIHEVSATFYVHGLGPGEGITVTLLDVDPSGAVDPVRIFPRPSDGATFGLVPDVDPQVRVGIVYAGTFQAPLPFSGVRSLGIDGYTLPKGHAIQMQVQLTGPAILHLDTADYPSFFQVRSDSARVNLWTEDRLGQVTSSFPAPDAAGSTNRQVVLKALQAEVWGNEDCRATNPDATDNGECTADNLFQREHRVRVRDLTPEHVTYNQLLPLDVGFASVGTHVECCDSETHPIQYEAISTSAGVGLFEYRFHYGVENPDGTSFLNGRYRFEFLQAGKTWSAPLEFVIGPTGFTLELAPGETDSHTVAVGEPTEFDFILRNVGGTTDRFGLAIASPGGGWAATVAPSIVTLAPEGETTVTVTVVPPLLGDSAQPGVRREVRLTAVSLTDNALHDATVSVTITGARTPGVELLSERPSIETRGGLVQSFPLALRNTGTARDTFVLTSSGLPAGWTAQLEPAFLDVPAQSRQDVILHLTAPVEAVPPVAFTLQLKAASVSTTALDTLDLPVSLFFVDDFLLDVLDGDMRLFRDTGDDLCFEAGFQIGLTCQLPVVSTLTLIQQDTRFDPSTVYRVRLQNTGDREDTFTFEADWNIRSMAPNGPDQDNNNCDESTNGNAPDGIPDGWRVWLLPGTGTPLSFTATLDEPTGVSNEQIGPGRSFENIIGSIALDPGQAVDAYVQVGWFVPEDNSNNGSACSAVTTSFRSEDPSLGAQLLLTVRSNNDPSLRQVKTLTSDLQGTAIPVDARGNHPFASHGVAVEPGIDPTTQRVELLEKSTAPGGEIHYRMHAINTGNEEDTLRIKLAVPQGAWPARIDVDGSNPSAADAEDIFIPPTSLSIYPTPQMRQARACNPNPDGSLVCTGMGVYDEVHFTIVQTPPLTAKVGDASIAAVTVSSGAVTGEGSVFDTALLTGRVTGTFLFSAEERAPDLDAEAGDVASFPFSVRNLGTNSDTYLLTVLEGNAAWLPHLASAAQVTVPAGRTHHGYLTVTAPAGATVGSVEHFRVQVQGLMAPAAPRQTEILDFFAHVVAADGRLELRIEPFTILSGTRQAFDVEAVDSSQAATEVRFEFDRQHLPRGWTVVCGDDVACVTGSEHVDRRLFTSRAVPGTNTFESIAIGDFTLDVPVGELGTSRVALRICGTTDGGVKACRDAEINLASTYGISLPTETLEGVAAAGLPFDYTVNVTNTGLTPQTVAFTFSNPPSGWSVDPVTAVAVQPGQTVPVTVTVRSPATASPGTVVNILLQAAVQQATTEVDTLTLRTRIGDYGLGLDAVRPEVFVAPQETAVYVLNVTGLGDFPDRARLAVALPVAYTRSFQVAWQGCDPAPDILDLDPAECILALDPEETRQPTLAVTMPEDLVAGVRVNMTVQAESLGAGGDVLDSLPIRAEVLPYVAQDVDGDGVGCVDDEGEPVFCAFLEFAVDRNQDDSDGFEEFRENLEPSGIRTRPADLARYLSDEAREAYTVEVVAADGSVVERLDYVLDPDNDGLVDHFLDTGADGLPDLYWDPDGRLVFPLTLTKDVTVDGVREYFIDLDGDGRLDVWFDIVEGHFGALLDVFANEDNIVDYVVDLDGDGQGDPGEPILIGSPLGFGAISSIFQKVDMNGDCREGIAPEDCLDTVIDQDADGNPDFFIPAGSTASIPITLKDVTDDGVADWTYPSKGEGRPDAYYDPVTGESGFIDTRAQFVQELQKYWYIGALFLVVLVLFVVLVAVTRR